MRKRVVPLALGVLLVAISVGCNPTSTRSPEDLSAAPIADHEDAVCGMLVRDQPAPRGQVIHRDGTRLFFCSLGDLLVHRSAPSPHGPIEAVFVEVLEIEEDASDRSRDPHPWRDASEAAFVVGVSRPGIMGTPVLAYADVASAGAVAQRHPPARVLDLGELEAWWELEQAGQGASQH